MPCVLSASLKTSPSETEAVGGAIDRFQEHQQIRSLYRGQRPNLVRARPIRPQPMQREYILQGLGLAAVQVRRVIVDTEQRRRLNPFTPNAVLAAALSRISRGLVISNVPTFSRYWMVGALQVNDYNSFANASRCRREPGDAGVQG